MGQVPTFSEINKFMDEGPHIWEAFKPLIKLVLLVAPGLAVGGFDMSSNVIELLGSGVTLIDIMDTIEEAFFSGRNLVKKQKNDFYSKYEKAQIANALLVFSAYFDTVQQNCPDLWRALELTSDEAQWLTEKAKDDYGKSIELMGSDGRKILIQNSGYRENLKCFYVLLNKRMQKFTEGLDSVSDIQVDWKSIPDNAVSNFGRQFVALCQNSAAFAVWTEIQTLESLLIGQSKIMELVRMLPEEIQSQKQVSAPPKLYLPPLALLRNQGFVGRRTELEALHKAILEGEDPIITGLGGIGKTELAVYFGRRIYTRGNTYFVRFRNSFRETVTFEIAQGIPGLLEKKIDEQSRYKMVIDLLRRCSENDILIIDNVDQEGSSFSKLTSESAYTDLCNLPMHIVITTRFEVPRSIKVYPLENTDLYQIFLNHDVKISEQEMDDLIEAVNGHSLTIDLIARTLSGGWNSVTAQELIKAFHNKSVPYEDYQEISTDYNRSTEEYQIYRHLSIVFNLSGIPSDALEVLRCATLLPQSGLFLELFRQAFSESSTKVLNALSKHGWLGLQDNKVFIHPVIRMVCWNELKPNDENCELFLNSIGCKDNRLSFDVQKYSQLAELFSNAARDLSDHFGRWAIHAGWFWAELGNYQISLDHNLKALDRQKQIQPEDYSTLLVAYNNAGIISSAMGEHESALSYLLKAKELFEKNRFGNPLDIASINNNIGDTYGALGDYARALEYKFLALKFYRIILPDVHLILATSYSSIGKAYNDYGDYNKSLEFALKALAIRKKIQPPNDLDLAESYNNIGEVYSALENHLQALSFERNALAILKKVLPSNHPTLASVYSNIGTTCSALGHTSIALKFLNRSLEIHSQVFPDTHPKIAQSFTNLSDVYSNSMNLDVARHYAEKALMIQKKALPEKHPHLAQTYNNLGYIYNAMGKPDLALKFMQNAINIWKEVLPDTHPHVLLANDNIGYIYSALGDHNKALEHAKQTLQIRENLFSGNHPDIARSLNNVGFCFIAFGEYSKALESLLKAYCIGKQRLHPNHDLMYTLCMNLAAVYNKMGRYKEELDYQLQAISIMEKRFPQKHFSRITHYEGVADTYFVLGDYPHAKEYYLKAVALLEELQPEGYRNIAIFYGKLGKSFSKLGNHPKALEYKSKVLKLRQKELPHLHPDMAVAYNNIAFTYAQLGDYESALNHVRTAAEIARQTLPEDHQARMIYDKAVATLEQMIFLSSMGIDFPNPFV